eukprot:4261550-Alexandrium_andersonii.AAC.1
MQARRAGPGGCQAVLLDGHHAAPAEPVDVRGQALVTLATARRAAPSAGGRASAPASTRSWISLLSMPAGSTSCASRARR